MASGKRSLMLTLVALVMTAVMLPSRVEGGPALARNLTDDHGISKLGQALPCAGFVSAFVFRVKFSIMIVLLCFIHFDVFK